MPQAYSASPGTAMPVFRMQQVVATGGGSYDRQPSVSRQMTVLLMVSIIWISPDGKTRRPSRRVRIPSR
jgi:hypothetical protein